MPCAMFSPCTRRCWLLMVGVQRYEESLKNRKYLIKKQDKEIKKTVDNVADL
jgi:hypothetical protein